MRRIRLMLLISTLFACTSEPSDTLIGKWGAATVELRATRDRAHVALECGGLTTEGPLTPDATGHFLVEAIRHSSFPSGEYPSHLEGRVNNGTLELRWWFVGSEAPEQFIVLEPGVRADIRGVACPV